MKAEISDIIKIKDNNPMFKKWLLKEKDKIEFNEEQKSLRIDFHGKSLQQVKNWFKKDLILYNRQGYTKIICIHGYRHGTVIRDYIRGNLISEFIEIIPKMKLAFLNKSDGTTILYITKL